MRKPGCTPKKTTIETKVRLTGQTVDAAKTVLQRIHGDSIAHTYSGHTAADFDHFSRNFMSEHQGFADLEIQDSAFMVIVQVGSADSSGTEPHQDLAILRTRRLRAILDFELMSSVNDTSNHKGLGGQGSGWSLRVNGKLN